MASQKDNSEALGIALMALTVIAEHGDKASRKVAKMGVADARAKVKESA